MYEKLKNHQLSEENDNLLDIKHKSSFGFTMAEQKDMCSSPARAPKLQLAVGQPLSGGH